MNRQERTQLNRHNPVRLCVEALARPFVVAALLLLTISSWATSGMCADSDLDPTYIILLVDASGSMKSTDANELRILAAQTVLAFIAGDDRAAVIEFSDKARILSGFRGSEEREALFAAAGDVGKNGMYTDFRIGMQACAEMFRRAPANARKSILLLTDGRFEPNLGDDSYAPYYLQYRKEVAGKDRDQREQIQERFRAKVLPVARRMIDADILPELVKSGVEVYSVSLGAGADQEFLSHVTRATSRGGSEIRMFRAAEASELTEAFLQILKYIKSNMLIAKSAGALNQGTANGSLQLDAYLENVLCIAYSDHPIRLGLTASDGTATSPIVGTHGDLEIVSLPDPQDHPQWTYELAGERGAYLFLAVGQSKLRVDVQGLKRQYLFGEAVEADVLLTIDGRDSRGDLSDSSSVMVTVGDEVEDTWKLPWSDKGYHFRFAPPHIGNYSILFEVEAKDRATGRDLLPRSSKQYAMEVTPGFMVLSESLDFGDLGKGRAATRQVRMVTGVGDGAVLTYGMELTASSADLEPGTRGHTPMIEDGRLEVSGSRTVDIPITVAIPRDCRWGDFEGIVQFQISDLGSRGVPFRVHVPSIWERLRIPTALLAVVLIAFLVALIVAWGALGSPTGTLVPLEVPAGEVLGVIRVGHVRQGVWARTLNFRKNIVTLGRTGTHIRLRSLPPALLVELRFFRFGGNYVVNCSPERSGRTISIETDLGPIERGPGQSSGLRPEIKIRIGEYLFAYRRF